MTKPIWFEKNGIIYEAEQVPLKASLINVTDKKTTSIVVDSIKNLGNGKYEILLFGDHAGWERRFEVEDIRE